MSKKIVPEGKDWDDYNWMVKQGSSTWIPASVPTKLVETRDGKFMEFGFGKSILPIEMVLWDKKPGLSDWDSLFVIGNVFFGLEVSDRRFMLILSGDACRCWVNTSGTWCGRDVSEDYYYGRGNIKSTTHQFNSKKELFEWMAGNG